MSSPALCPVTGPETRTTSPVGEISMTPIHTGAPTARPGPRNDGSASRRAGSVVDRLVDGGPEVEHRRQPLVARMRPLLHEDRRHVLRGIVVPDGAPEAGPPVASHGGSEVRA